MTRHPETLPFSLEFHEGESLLWWAQPDTRSIFDPEDVVLIPFSIAWSVIVGLWEAAALGIDIGLRNKHTAPYQALLGIPLILAALHLLAGRFIYRAWSRPRTWYVITNHEVLIVLDGLTGRTVKALPVDSMMISAKRRENSGRGSLYLRNTRRNSRGATRRGLLLSALPDVDHVVRLITSVIDQAQGPPAVRHP